MFFERAVCRSAEETYELPALPRDVDSIVA